MTQIVYVTKRIKVMDRKFYVSLEAAKLLKEKGYNNYSTVYDCSVEGDILLNQEPMHGEWAGEKDVYPCPTKAEAIAWLESKCMIVIIDVYYIILEENGYHTSCWGYCIIKNNVYVCGDNSSDYLTRLEAEDEAIIKALELI